MLGGHAVLAVGYDSEIEVNRDADGKIEKGAFIIKNSWGEKWGDGGFAYLPFHYVLNQLAVDLWTIFNSQWIDEGAFED